MFDPVYVRYGLCSTLSVVRSNVRFTSEPGLYFPFSCFGRFLVVRPGEGQEDGHRTYLFAFLCLREAPGHLWPDACPQVLPYLLSSYETQPRSREAGFKSATGLQNYSRLWCLSREKHYRLYPQQ
jgi:hypothetical protein